MQQYFIKECLSINKSFCFDREQSHHIVRVLRMRSNDIVKVVDIDENPFMVRLIVEDKNVYGIPYQSLNKKEEAYKVTLIQGMIKKEKWDFLIQKCCELGISRIIPMISSRTIVKVDASDKKKMERYNKIALEACEQCKRDSLVKVENPILFKEIKQIKGDLRLIAYEDENYPSRSLKEVLNCHPASKNIIYVIGSEGGFSKEEIHSLVEEGFICVTLGSRILRAETAAISVINNIHYHFD